MSSVSETQDPVAPPRVILLRCTQRLCEGGSRPCPVPGACETYDEAGDRVMLVSHRRWRAGLALALAVWLVALCAGVVIALTGGVKP